MTTPTASPTTFPRITNLKNPFIVHPFVPCPNQCSERCRGQIDASRVPLSSPVFPHRITMREHCPGADQRAARRALVSHSIDSKEGAPCDADDGCSPTA